MNDKSNTELNEDRLTQLEERLAHQELALDNLTRSSLDHDRLLADIRNQLEHIKSMLKELAPGQADDIGSEPPPPHY